MAAEFQLLRKPRRESSQAGARCRDGKKSSIEDKNKDNKGRSREKGKARWSSVLENHGHEGKDALSRKRASSRPRGNPHSETRKEIGQRTEARMDRESTKVLRLL